MFWKIYVIIVNIIFIITVEAQKVNITSFIAGIVFVPELSIANLIQKGVTTIVIRNNHPLIFLFPQKYVNIP